MILKSPACPAQCDVCALSCSVLPKRLKYWRKEVERLENPGTQTDGSVQAAALLNSAQDIADSLLRQLSNSNWNVPAALAVLA